jgi:hypothetical protein
MNAKDEALKMAIDEIQDLMQHIKDRQPDMLFTGSEYVINACKEALEQPAQEPVAWMKSAIDNARDVCKYLDHGRINDAMAHTKFFWADLDKIKEVEDALSDSDSV